jgi:hypothetical protein
MELAEAEVISARVTCYELDIVYLPAATEGKKHS